MIALLPFLNGLPTYRDRIPNGHNVPHPCIETSTWVGVGHWTMAGGGERNPFGIVSTQIHRSSSVLITYELYIDSRYVFKTYKE